MVVVIAMRFDFTIDWGDVVAYVLFTVFYVTVVVGLVTIAWELDQMHKQSKVQQTQCISRQGTLLCVTWPAGDTGGMVTAEKLLPKTSKRPAHKDAYPPFDRKTVES